MYIISNIDTNRPKAAKYFKKYKTGWIINMLVRHKIANSIAKKKGVILPFNVNLFLFFLLILLHLIN